MTINLNKKNVINPDVFFAFAVGIILFILIFPLNNGILSFMLVANISISVLLLMLVFYIKSPLEISSFPTLLLVLTLFRLSLNVASTKLILLEQNAGSVIQAFGDFVVGGEYIVGAIVFLILVIINFLVIIKGSSRIAEVSARFTLDAMPGKQMSIDSDLNAGLIDESEAKKRRQDLADEAEFYGAMDGASKFVTGDAIAGLVITAINIIAGIAIGVLQKDMSVTDAMSVYTILTVGDGLVSQIPALLISVSAGMLVAKTNSGSGATGAHLFSQLFSRPEPLFICSIMIFSLGVIGFSFWPFTIFALTMAGAGFYVMKRNNSTNPEMTPAYAGANNTTNSERQKELPAPAEAAKTNQLPQIHPMTLEVGFTLVPLVDPNQDGDLVDRISQIRKQILEELGFMIPPISIQDNINLNNNDYRILVRGLERARGTIFPQSHLAINPGDSSDMNVQLEGVKTVDPAFGFDAVWISQNQISTAENAGFTVVDASSVVTTHVTKIVKDYAGELLSRQDISNMLDNLKEKNSTVIEELIPNLLSIGAVHRVLQILLSERVPIHDIPSILEHLSDYATQTKDPVILAEFARQALKGHIIAKYVAEDRTLYAMTIDPALENEIQDAVSEGRNGGMLSLAPERALEITEAVKEQYESVSDSVGFDVVILASPLIRLHLFRLLDRKIEEVPVISYSEVSDDVPLKILGTIRV